MSMSTHRTRRQFLHTGSVLCAGSGLTPFINCRKNTDRRPNIVFLYTDQQHGFTVSGSGDYQFDTPAIDWLAERGITFSHAFCSTPQCSPSRASLMTGQYPHRTGVITNEGHAAGRGIPLNPALPTIGSLFRSNGYATVYYGKWHLGGHPESHGWNVYQKARGRELTQLGIQFLQTVPREPFFLFLSYLNPHDVYHFPQHMHTTTADVPLPHSFTDDLSTKPIPHRQFMQEDQGKYMSNADETVWRKYRRFYREKVQAVDAEIGCIIKTLETSGYLDNTLVILTSDHGDMDTAHRLIYKGPFMYEELLRIPLIVSYPAVFPAGEIRDQLVQNIDLLPFLSDIAGIQLPYSPDGISFLPIVHDHRQHTRTHIFAEYYAKQEWVNPIRTIRTAEWKYSVYQSREEELYHLQDDPLEMVNLAPDIHFEKQKSELQTILKNWMQQTDDYFHTLRPTDRTGQVLDL